MPTVIITDLSPGGLFVQATDNARRASAEIERLLYTAFEPGETREDRALKVAAHARVLAEAFTIIDSLASSPNVGAEIAAMCDCSNCRPAVETDNTNTN
jgi:hypothetical protein